MSTLDYHIHTIVSTDADYTPAEIIRMAKKNGVKTLAITDHNNVASVAEAASLGEAEGIRVIQMCIRDSFGAVPEPELIKSLLDLDIHTGNQGE